MFASKDFLLTRPSGGYTIARSVRFRSSATAYFNRTPASVGNLTTWTWSGWVKRGTLSTAQFLIGAGTVATTDVGLFFESSAAADTLIFSKRGSIILTTTQLFRDPSAWYHIVVAYDSTQGTASNRLKMYVNGSQITSFSTTTYPTASETTQLNNNVTQYIGRRSDGVYFDGYLTEINFIDGQALTPSSFGETDSITGVWKPKAYSGTYGTNGFELNFSDNSNNTAATIGKDYSGNGNNWTPNNISVTAGVTYDSMTDVPTLTSATASNFAVLNPLMAAAPALVDGNLNTPSLSAQTVYGTISSKSGKWYWEGKCTARATGVTYVGVENNTYFLSNQAWSTSVFAMQSNSQKYLAGTSTSYGSGFAAGDTIGVALDVTNDTLEFFVNNTSQGQITSVGMAQNNMRPMFQGNTATWEVNFGQRPFTYTPPTGYVALNTYNLPTSTITNGAGYMAATTYAGTGASLTVANTVGSTSFQPDWVWAKSRSAATDHALYDSVRGVQKQLESNNTDAETTETTGLTAFGSTGFTVGALAQMNTSAATYVAWQWKAGTTSASNTSGSITSTVSVGATQGFSVVTYTATAATGTIGHGLGVAPSMIITARRSSASAYWGVYHKSLGASQILYMQVTNAATADSTTWNATSPTSSVFSVGNSAQSNNPSSATYVAYCFAPIAGYSAFGSYTGNGSTDGVFVYCGFRPRWILIKSSTTTDDWRIYDTSRPGYNVQGGTLLADTAGAETTATELDILSNGFKARVTTTPNAAQTYIYAAFAESPFKNSLAR